MPEADRCGFHTVATSPGLLNSLESRVVDPLPFSESDREGGRQRFPENDGIMKPKICKY